mgnify:CR=1 FL=1
MGIFNLTESEKKEILNLHNSARIIKEQSTPPLDDKAKIEKIQTLLNTKYNTGLKVDGILGQNTLTALSNAMKSAKCAVTFSLTPVLSVTSIASFILTSCYLLRTMRLLL